MTAASPRPPGRRAVRAVTVFLVVVLLEVLAVGVWAATRAVAARDELLAARQEASRGRELLGDLELADAEDAFATAAQRFADGHALLSDPVVSVAAVAPLVGDDIAAARDLALAGERVAEAVRGVVHPVVAAGGVDALAPTAGRIPVDVIASLAEPARRAAAGLADARALAANVPDDGVNTILVDARDELVEQLEGTDELVGLAVSTASVLPELLGAEEPRRYVFGAQQPAELRGTGGFLGAYSILELDDGALSFSEFIPIQDLTSLPRDRVRAPNRDYAARYDRFGGAGFWQAINATPDFPSAATAIERLWERTRGEQVDGVIAVDPIAFESLLEMSGPVDVPGFGTVGADDVVEVVALEAYGQIDKSERKEVLGEIAASALLRALSGDVDPVSAVDALLDVADRGHLMMHAEDPAAQALIQRLGLAGELGAGGAGDFLSVVANSASFTKLDYFIDRHVTYRVELAEDGSASGTATVRFDNDAPERSDLPRNVIGPGWDGRLAEGEQRSWVSIYCGVGCEPRGVGEAVVEEELGHGVVSDFVRVPRGESARMQASWTVADAWNPVEQRYILTYEAQPTLRPTRLDLEVVPPPGWRVVSALPTDAKVEHETTYEIELTRDAA